MINKFKEQYEKKGYFVLKNFFSRSDIDYAKNQIEIYINKSQKVLKSRKGSINYTNKKINSLHTLHTKKNLFKKLFNNSKLNNILKKLLGKKIKLRAIELFAKPAKHGLPSPMHQDNFYWNLKKGQGLTVWVCLDSSNTSNGGITYIPGSHNEGLLNHEPSFAPGSSQMVSKVILRKMREKYKLSTPDLKLGDICIHNCLIIHGSGKNKSNISRKGLTFQFKNAYDRYDKNKIYQYKKSLKKQILLRK